MTKRDKIKSKFGGKCAYCGCELGKYWHVDHLLPLVRNPLTGCQKHPERNEISNLVPSCASCNNYKHSYSIDEFRRLISDLKRQLNENSNQYKIAKRYGLINEVDIDVIFYFETVK